MAKVYFIGAGPGDPELITVKGQRILLCADVVITAGSLVNKEILQHARHDAEIVDSAGMDLTEIVEVMRKAHAKGKDVARLHTGEPSLYGAVLEQMAELDKLEIDYESIPGVTSLFAAAAAMNCELTLPEISQTVIISRYAGRTPVPEDFSAVAKAGGTLCLYLSAGFIEEITAKLIAEGRSPETPAAVVYRASWPDEKIIKGTLKDIGAKLREADIRQHALIIVGEVVSRQLKNVSKLYDSSFSHGCRDAKP